MEHPKKKIHIKLFSLTFLFTILLSSCENKVEPPIDTYEGPEQTEITISELNNWIWKGMNTYYLWNKQIPQTLDPATEKDPKILFGKMLSKEDRWSFITDNNKALQGSFAGKEKATGASLGVFNFYKSETVFAVVEYVYPNSPASQAGLKRGNIILQVNGKELNKNNFQDLLFGQKIYINSPWGNQRLQIREILLNPPIKPLK